MAAVRPLCHAHGKRREIHIEQIRMLEIERVTRRAELHQNARAACCVFRGFLLAEQPFRRHIQLLCPGPEQPARKHQVHRRVERLRFLRQLGAEVVRGRVPFRLSRADKRPALCARDRTRAGKRRAREHRHSGHQSKCFSSSHGVHLLTEKSVISDDAYVNLTIKSRLCQALSRKKSSPLQEAASPRISSIPAGSLRMSAPSFLSFPTTSS